jgi:hypothetical protein
MLQRNRQCCRTGTGTAGTVTFCFGRTGTGARMHYGSGYGGTRFGSGFNMKCKKVKKSKMKGQLSGK